MRILFLQNVCVLCMLKYIYTGNNQLILHPFIFCAYCWYLMHMKIHMRGYLFIFAQCQYFPLVKLNTHACMFVFLPMVGILRKLE